MSTTHLVANLRTTLWLRPRWYLALKTALAATLAWLATQPLGDLGEQYSYYAPLGAVAAMTTAVVDSIRSAAHAVLAIALGAALALTLDLLPLARPVSLGLAIAVAVIVGGWSALGTMGGWVPLAAMFVLIAGAGDPLTYTAAYAGLTALGAAVGVAVNAVLPHLPLTPAAQAQDRLRAELANELDRLSTFLRRDVADEKDWAALRTALARQARRADELTKQARESRRANWQAPRWALAADRRDRRAQALLRLTGIVDGVIALVADQRTDIRRDEPASAQLRAVVADSLSAVATLIRESPDDEQALDAAARRAHDAVEDLRAQVVQVQQRSSLPHLAAAAIALELDAAVDAWS